MPEDYTASYFTRIASKYERCVVDGAKYAAPGIVADLVLKHVDGKPALKVLDVACGTGLASVRFLESGFDVTGLDVSAGMLEVARQRPYKRLICQNVEDLWAVDDGEFDIVVAVGVLEFIEHLPEFMQQIHRKLKGGGLCGITMPVRSSVTENYDCIAHRDPEFRETAKAANLRVLEAVDFPGWETGHLEQLEGPACDTHELVEYRGYVLQKPKCRNARNASNCQ